MKKRSPTFWVVFIIICIIVGVGFSNVFQSPPTTPLSVISYSEFVKLVEEGRVLSVAVTGPHLTGNLEGSAFGFQTYLPTSELPYPLSEKMLSLGVEISAQPQADETFLAYVVSWLPVIIFYFFLWLVLAKPLRALVQQLEKTTAVFEAAVHKIDGSARDKT